MFSVQEDEWLVEDLAKQPARLGAWLLVLCSAAIALSVWALVPAAEVIPPYVVVAVVLAFGAGVRLLPRRLTSGHGRLIFPGLVLAELVGLALLSPAATLPYTPLINLAFIYLGLTCPPRASWMLMAPAAATWLLANHAHGGFTAATFVRLPISMTVWILVGELLARYVTQVRRHTELLADQVHTDPLTGLANRRLLPDLLAAARTGDALVMLDVDDFRAVNQTLGHVGGDEVLRRFGAVIAACLRRQDRAVRYGGEEILILLPAVFARAGMDAALARISDTWRVNQPDITFSAGGVVLAEGQSPDDALRHADVLLYEAKQAGRDCWRLAVPEAAAQPATLGQPA
jgi:diguanylate cyclase (GGDEF)-like protein